MRRYVYVTGALLSILLTALAVGLIVVRTGQMPRVVSVGPLLAALVACVASWWLQALIVATLARPWLKRLRVGETFRIYMAGTFVVSVSPVRGAEIPYEAYLLKRLGLSAAQGSTVVLSRVLLDVVVLIPAVLGVLTITGELPTVEAPNLLLAGLAVAGIWAAVAFLLSRRRRVRSRSRKLKPDRSGWRIKISCFLADVRRSFAAYRQPGHRATLVFAIAFTAIYWALRLSSAPLALMAVGWSGEWLPVVVAQLLLNAVILPFVPTPGGSGTRELGLASLLSAHVPEVQLLGGIVLYTGLTYCLPAIIGAYFFGEKIWRGIEQHQGPEEADRRSYIQSAVAEADASSRPREPIMTGSAAVTQDPTPAARER